jgi:ribonuclease R
MLPHTLSNGICSLNAGEDRLALSCIMLINPQGKVIDYEIAETVIHVDARMTYTSVNKILTGDEAEAARYEALVPMFYRMNELAGILRKRRRQRGSIDFDFPESKIILDAQGMPVEIRPYERNAATKLIEDFMLIANETVAEDNFWQEVPFMYRTHEKPDPDRIKKLAAFINNFGYTIHTEGGELHPKELQKLLEKIADTPHETLISRLTLRSMKQAKYTTDETGHFGLASRYYCHFTSPIRRYPDLQIHRIIKDRLRGRMSDAKKEHYEKILPAVAKLTSERERRAEEAERDTVKLKKVQYMSGHMGERFVGVISSVTAWGMYVELPNTVEGMVHVTSLKDDFYHYIEESYELVGETTGKSYKLGQTLTVVVTGTDELMRTIDFDVVEEK